uniref:Uncharacterized protein n=2 Tax=Caenorhabditis japonica TaxID=281687 RepID=A0A8R1EVP9_CAEJA
MHKKGKSRLGKWTPGMSRSQKIALSDYQYDPLCVQSGGSPRPYHIKEYPKRHTWKPDISRPLSNKYFYDGVCKEKLTGVDKYWAEKHRREDKEKAKFFVKKYKRIATHQIRIAKFAHKQFRKRVDNRSVAKSVTDLRRLSIKDCQSDGTRSQKFATMTRVQKMFAKNIFVPPYKKTVVLSSKLNLLDVIERDRRIEKIGPTGCDETIGYIEPDYAPSLYSLSEEEFEAEIDEQRNALGEGTSDQYLDGEEVDAEMNELDVDDTAMEIDANIGHAKTAVEHMGPDGLLSPPASNEMPKGGPLSVGPPSVESQGLNQIYPTPPSVQMLHGDAAQPHSPHSTKPKSVLSVVEEDVERIAVPGGVATVVEIVADDPETANMKKWNKTVGKSKLSQFLAASCNDPVLSARKKKFATPITDKFKVYEPTEKVDPGMTYKPMADRNFENAPPRAFALLVRSKFHEKRMAAITAAAAAAAAAVTPVLHQPSPMVPIFQPPALPMHTSSPSVGPMAHHPMGPPGYPPITPTYPMGPRPGSNFGPPGPGYPPHPMMGPGYPGQRGPGGFVGPQNVMHPQQLQMMRMQQMMHNRQMGGMPGMPPPPPHFPPGPGPGPTGYNMPPHTGPSSVQQLNNFVNQSRFGQNTAHGMPPPVIPQSPNFNQAFNGNPMISPMQQHQFHQQQMHQQQLQSQMQRNQMQQQQQQQQQQFQQQQQIQQHQQQIQQQQQQIQQQSLQPPQPSSQQLHAEQQAQLRAAYQSVSFRNLSFLNFKFPKKLK